ncbi:MAG TPA: YggS family pyridoxal phosphate-dependent enzyme [Calditrichaeota bacterium]|nr:YggS family pyridoxal phosphate-dependent enzyme [Calditrichota bacterium]
MEIKESFSQIFERISDACKRVGRDPAEVRLVAVSKTITPDIIMEAYGVGQRDFGENRAQDFRDKARVLPADIQWHFIGHLQSNKIKYVVPKAILIHSVDSWELAQALSEYCSKHSRQSKILLQVNTSGEVSKFGIAPDKAKEIFLRIYEELPNISLQGLMTMAPLTDNEKTIRSTFKALKQLQEKLGSRVKEEVVSILSMGMTHDFEIAIEEGSTMVRIGTALFGNIRR